VPFKSVLGGRRLNRGSGCRRHHEPPGLHSHPPTTISGEILLLVPLLHTEYQATRSRPISRHISSSSTSAYCANITTTGNPLHQLYRIPELHRIPERAHYHSAEGYLKIEATIEASPLRLRTLPPPPQSQLINKKFKAPVHSVDFLKGVSMKSPSPYGYRAR